MHTGMLPYSMWGRNLAENVGKARAAYNLCAAVYIGML